MSAPAESSLASIAISEPGTRRVSTRIVVVSCWPVGTKIVTKFSGVPYVGTVTKILPPTREDKQLWHVQYDDGDEADLDEKEMETARKLYVDTMLDVDVDPNDDDDDDDSSSDNNRSSDDEYHPFE